MHFGEVGEVVLREREVRAEVRVVWWEGREGDLVTMRQLEGGVVREAARALPGERRRRRVGGFILGERGG